MQIVRAINIVVHHLVIEPAVYTIIESLYLGSILLPLHKS